MAFLDTPRLIVEYAMIGAARRAIRLGEGRPAVEGVVNCAAYAGGQRVSTVELEDIGELLKQPGRFVWIG